MRGGLSQQRVLTVALVCFALALICFSMIGCSSPTQPSETRYLWQLTAKGCTPAANAPVPSGEPLLEISGTTITPLAPMANGRDVVLVQWSNVNALFLQEGSIYALCTWWRP